MEERVEYIIEKNLERLETAKKSLKEKLDEGWNLEVHTKDNPLTAKHSSGIEVELVFPYTAISPNGYKYHGNQSNIDFGPFRINRGRYSFFSDESYDKKSISEINQAFEIFSTCEEIGKENLLGFLKEIKSS